jgi:magnesium-transporting ATPase (P-type)
MGSGARVTKDVSDIVLIKDTFEIMPEILSQGQKIIQGVKNITKLFLFKNTYAILLITLTQFIDIKFPFTPQQVTMINFITISLPTVFVIGFSDKGSFMDRDYLKDIAVHSLTAGLVTALVTLFVTIISVVWLGNDHMLTKTLVVSTIIILGLFNYLYVTTSPKRAKDLLDKKLITQILLFLIFLPGGVYLSKYMFNYFSLKPLGLKEWAIVLSSSAIGMIGFYFSCKYNVLYRIFKPVKLPGKEG